MLSVFYASVKYPCGVAGTYLHISYAKSEM